MCTSKPGVNHQRLLTTSRPVDLLECLKTHFTSVRKQNYNMRTIQICKADEEIKQCANKRIVTVLWTIFPCHMDTHQYECSTCWFSNFAFIHIKGHLTSARCLLSVCVHVSSFSPASFISIFINCDSDCEGCEICLTLTLMLVHFNNLCCTRNSYSTPHKQCAVFKKVLQTNLANHLLLNVNIDEKTHCELYFFRISCFKVFNSKI